nr:MAG TPA: hypothetical protein [Caudoviricetes sp.]
MIKVEIDGLQARDYISPTGDWNYEAIDALAKALCDKYREAETEQLLEEFKKYTERTSMNREIDPLSIDYIRDQIGWMVRPLVHHNMTMREWLQVNALTYEIVEELLPSYLDDMALLSQMRTQLDDVAAHRYLITPFKRKTTP